MARERFRDGAGVLTTYEFQVNHSEEESAAFAHNMERTANTAGVGFVRQQGNPSPRILKYSGTIFTQAQYDAMKSYFDACANRTVFFRDFTGEEMEVLITAFDPKRIRTIRNPRDVSLLHYWKYTIEMEVIA